jgi:hypothetical protein
MIELGGRLAELVNAVLFELGLRSDTGFGRLIRRPARGACTASGLYIMCCLGFFLGSFLSDCFEELFFKSVHGIVCGEGCAHVGVPTATSLVLLVGWPSNRVGFLAD